MSAQDISIPGWKLDLSAGVRFTEVVPLNDVLETELRHQQHLHRLKLISRCATLPSIAGNAGDLSMLFRNLLDCMLADRPQEAQCYLHVECEIVDGEADGNSLIAIRLKTNLIMSQDWKERHDDQLRKCHQILLEHGGILMVNNLSNTGCLFTLTLPGKM